MGYDKTVVAVSKSQEGIRRMIYAHRGTGISFISQPPREGLEAMMTINNTPYLVRIMATCRAKVFDKEQEERRVWRVLYWHLKAVFESADSGVIDIRDVIMPYVVTPDGHTLAERIIPRLEVVLKNPDRLLPANVNEAQG